MRQPLFAVLIGLIISPVAVAQTESQTASCALRQPQEPQSRGLGTILSFQTSDAARAAIPGREARLGGAIDPRYLDDQRAVVRQDNGLVDIYDVPAGVAVHVGDHVRLQGSYRSMASACSYIPILLFPADLPGA